ncbi:hypothetical protein A2U01_0099650, partial [Trifolium medium]|nr:hypothetical protein [Trifolium medium]MCI78380.1 hypothetical protein [Trifolium medium]
MVDSRALSD